MITLTLALFFIPAALGISAAAALKAATEKTELAMIGTIGGLTVFISLTYTLNLVFPLSNILLTGILLIAAVTTTLIVLFTPAWQNMRRLLFDKAALTSLIILIILFAVIASKLLFLADDGGLKTGIINAYGDLGWHIANITMFAEGQSFPPENPILADTRLTYPFLVNFFSAMLQVGGASINYSVVLPALVLIPTLLILVYFLVKRLTSRRSAAIIALLLFLFGGATLGWTRIYDDWQGTNTPVWEFITHLPQRDYSGVGNDTNGFHFLNPTFTLLLPQRPFLFGIPLAISILLLLTPTGRSRATKARFLAAGILAGLLPLFHAHTVLALIPAIIALFTVNPRRPWRYFAAAAITLGAPAIVYYLTSSSEAGSFFRWGPRWLAGDENIIWYWIKNTGLLIPTIALGFYLPAPRLSKALAAAGLTIFIIANLFLFAPWAWDNFKLFIYWFIFSLPLVSWVVIEMIKRHTNTFTRSIVIVLVIMHFISGALDLWKISLPTASTWEELDTASIKAAQAIKLTTEPGQSILTAPIHNSPVALSGRPAYLGYSAHVWSHGGNPWPREEAIKPFYEGELLALPESTPNYVLVGPAEIAKYPALKIRPSWQLVTQSGPYSLYKIP